MGEPRCTLWLLLVSFAVSVHGVACLRPPPGVPAPANSTTSSPSEARASGALPRDSETMPDLEAWDAASRMAPGINIGNALENTSTWETGWGNPRITRE